jgi:uncharacterized protein
METRNDHSITTVEQLRAVIGEPHPMVKLKVLNALDEHTIDFIKRSPFLVLSTADRAGNQDASPKGDHPGFVAIEDEHTLLIPERKGNKLAFGYLNILENPHVGMVFMIPGTGETLRVNGAAELTSDPVICERLTARGQPAILAIRVHIHECFFHCAKAFIRSQLWKPEAWAAPYRISFGKMMAAKTGAGQDVAEQIDSVIAKDYRDGL